MRVDTGVPTTSTGMDLDALAQVKRYLQALRRNWYLLAVFTLVGAALGWASGASSATTAASIGNKTRYYQAIHTVLRDTSPGSQGDQTYQITLPQAAYLVSEGTVPDAVAARLGLNKEDVVTRVAGVPREQVSSIEIKAIGTSPERVTALADTSAEVLIEQLDAQVRVAFEQTRDEVAARLDRLNDDLNATNLQLANDPGNSQLVGQQQSLTSQYSLAYEQFTELANQPAPSANLSSLQAASAEEISESLFTGTRDEIAQGLPYVTGATTTVPSAADGGIGGPGQGASAPTRSGLGGMVGLGLAVGLVLLLDRFDNRLRHRDNVEAATGLTVLAEIPPLTHQQQTALEVVAHTQHRSRAAEAYRVVRSALLFAVNADKAESTRPNGDALVVMVTSANPEEGKTTTVANLAAVLAEGGVNVLVINCDFRRPRVHKYLMGADMERTDQAGLESDGHARIVVSPTVIERVKLITGIGESDPDANPLDVVAMQRKVIQTARQRCDVILLDTAPFLTTNDASELLSETDQVVLVVRAGKTRRLTAGRAAEILHRFEAPVLGVVLNDSDETPAAQYYYTYYLDGSGKKQRTEGYASHADPATTPGQAGVTPSSSDATASRVSLDDGAGGSAAPPVSRPPT